MIQTPNHDVHILTLLTAALRGDGATWPPQWRDSEITIAVLQQTKYHGIAGLLIERRDKLIGWPEGLLESLRKHVLGQVIWELRHKSTITNLLNRFSQEGISPIILKGTAIAYDLYTNPASRARGDSDILIAKADLRRARELMRKLGFHRHVDTQGSSLDAELQEMWYCAGDNGAPHRIDLHWQTMNFPALEGILSYDVCLTNIQKLPRLCETASAMSRVNMLLHACVHRAKHITSPYFSDEVAYYGGDRLIWAVDIDLIANALSEPEWARFCQLAEEQGVSAVCREGLQLAQTWLTTPVPKHVLDALELAPQATPETLYLLHEGKIERIWHDIKAIHGLRQKIIYFCERALPSSQFMREKYSQMPDKPLMELYLRRFIEFALRRSRRSKR